MRCRKAHKLMSAYLDQELSVREQEAVESHLAHCAPCRGEVQALTETKQLLAQAEHYHAPPALLRRVMTNLEPEATRPLPCFAPFLVQLGQAALILVIIGVGVVSGRFLTSTGGTQGPGDGVTTLSLELFDPAPPESLGGIYLAMMEMDYEE